MNHDLEVIYLPENPRKNSLYNVFNRNKRFALGEVVITWVFWVLLLGYTAFRPLSSYRKVKYLLSWGQPVLARYLGSSIENKRKQRFLAVRCSFSDHSGRGRNVDYEFPLKKAISQTAMVVKGQKFWIA